MSFNFRIGADAQQSYAVSTAQTNALQETENEKTRLTMGQDKTGDTISISQQGKDKLAAMQAGSQSSESTDSSSDPSSNIDQQIEKVKEQIEKVKEEIEELQKDPEKNKDQISAKQNELMQLQGQIVELQEQQNKASGTSSKGGTRAEGMGNSLT
ncbi:hypothetical protein [Maridesulfovibrio sp.]|uniref:hypothetical protein n=1 Tax=Maridesulfovibrio sp. TaxID=2795000 RepID=UPI0029CA3AFE|nr:hypothetical protein [Maridesulfovibrio sp.]